jgi:hypothetical protein
MVVPLSTNRRPQQEQFPHMTIISTTKSGHFIQLDEPHLIIDAIKQVMSKVKKAG